jgi:hypothetical protein
MATVWHLCVIRLCAALLRIIARHRASKRKSRKLHKTARHDQAQCSNTWTCRRRIR